MTAPAIGVLLCAGISGAYQIVQFAAARGFFRRAARENAARAGGHTPPVTILKPLKGPGLDLYANLASFCRQDYPVYQIVFGVGDPSDPAIDIVQRLRRDFPRRDIALVVGGDPGSNRKVASLVNMQSHARHDVMVLSDADIRVRPDYLRTMVAPLAEPDVGISTCLYRGRGYFGLPSVIESLFINVDFIPMVMMAQWVQEFRYAYGASIAFKREALDRIGGFAPLADFLADDYQLGNRVKRAGYRLVLLSYVVETVLDSVSLSDVWRHQLRWARTYAVCEPVGWFASVITHSILWGSLALLATGGAPIGWAALAWTLACRLGSVAGTMRLMGEPEPLRNLWLVPPMDLSYSVVWLWSWLGRHVDWSGQRFRVRRDGRMVAVGPSRTGGAPVAEDAGASPARGGGRYAALK
jgi:ceramide glucosyltransferase